jgi:hypothetical protein
MSSTGATGTPWWWLVVVLVLVGAGFTVWAGWHYYHPEPVPPSPSPPGLGTLSKAEVAEQTHQFCGACHHYPPAETFPRQAWKGEVEQGYHFFLESTRRLQPPPIDQVIAYYEDQAPEQLPAAKIEPASAPLSVGFAQVTFPGPPGSSPPRISYVQIVPFSDQRRPDLLVCDMRWGLILALKPYAARPAWEVLSDKVPHPAHVEVVDLNQDGIRDLLVADLGNFPPTDRRCGKVVWLRGTREGTLVPFTLLEDVGRVADVQAGDFRGVGKLDLVVASFGWQKTGDILYLENQTTNWDEPRFVSRVIDERHGAIHVPTLDLNQDGRLDFIALISQEFETVVAYLNEGDGQFRQHTLYTAPHPGYGSSGIQLTDLDGDKDVDVLYSNGDVLDAPYLLKPYHSIQWLENQGNLSFVHHHLTPMYGVHRAVAGDIDGDGDQDILAVSFLPIEAFPQRKEKKVDAIVVLEQTRPGHFVRHSLENITCDHAACALGDVFGNGRLDLVIGNYTGTQEGPPVTIWKNLGPGS